MHINNRHDTSIDMTQEKGPHSTSNEIMMAVLLFGASVGLSMALWYVLKYVYGWWRTAVYFVMSLGGLIPEDTKILGSLSRRYEHYAHLDKKSLLFWSDAVHDTLLVNLIGVLIITVIVTRVILKIHGAHPLAIFSKRLTIDTFTKQQMPLYPHLRVFWNLKMMTRSLTKGILRLTDNTKSFTISNALITPADGGADAEPILDEDRALRIFAKQLGRMLPMQSASAQYADDFLKCLDNNEKAILAATLPRLAACDSDVSDKDFDEAVETSRSLVTQFWETFYGYDADAPDPSGKPRPEGALAPPPPVNTASCDEVLRKYLPYTEVQTCLSRHAYISTFIYDALDRCRRIGVFPPPELRWLKFVDRRLWFIVHCAGSDTPFWEIAGVHSHYLFEEKANRPEEKPQVDRAVSALAVELGKLRFTEKERTKFMHNIRSYRMPAERPPITTKPN